MKKIVKSVFLFLCIIGGVFTISSCKEKGLVNNEKTQDMIKNDLIELLFADEKDITVDDIIIELYLGIYNDVYVAKYSSLYFFGHGYNEEIEGFHFEDPRTSPILVWKNHEFYDLKDAYEKNFLSLDNIVTIHNDYVKYMENK